ncbi:MAG: ABC transporter substrate-binding protein [Candidatus Melainabacteria bacterium]|nr:ABC transporter substrate-binding protein [Candidatus Melainabacteria bacterium]
MQNGILRYCVAALAPMLLLSFSGILHAADKPEYVQPKPLADQLSNTTLSPVKTGVLRVPTITWPGDVATIFTEQDGIFKAEGLAVELFCENDFAKQVRGVLDGETPFLRGDLGMINAAAPVFEKAGTELVVFYVLTRSTGGDVLVVRTGTNSLQDMKGKTYVLQLNGPHMSFFSQVLARGGLKTSDVNIKWVKELTLPAYDTKGKAVDPRTVFANDPTVDGCFVISPDAAAITSGGAEGVKGSKQLFSSKSADHVIFDVYACRADWFKANTATVEKFAHALLVGTEKFQTLNADKTRDAAKYGKLMTRSAELLFGSNDPKAVSDVEGSLGDCTWVGFQGNVNFFTGNGTTRSFAVLKEEIQTSFIDLGLLKAKAPLTTANWDYTKLANGLKNVDLTSVPKPTFDATKTQQAVENKIATELDKWNDEGSIYQFEVYFPPKAIAFDPTSYEDAFKKALELSATFGGALVVIEGHNAPDAVNRPRRSARARPKSPASNRRPATFRSTGRRRCAGRTSSSARRRACPSTSRSSSRSAWASSRRSSPTLRPKRSGTPTVGSCSG